ncbi:MAG: DUF488 domain-containing protein [Acidobacteriota bacterium]|nr:MAG: DUF488 domain-containing protein [Acidobacteriota bacterium]
MGHSDRSGEQLVELLRAARIELLVDVRSHPWSRRHPWHGCAEMEKRLREAGIESRWMGATLRGMRPDGYAAHQQTDAYKQGLAQLMGLARVHRAAILCAERDPWNCHRRHIADDLMRHGIIVKHLLDPEHEIAHQGPLL